MQGVKRKKGGFLPFRVFCFGIFCTLVTIIFILYRCSTVEIDPIALYDPRLASLQRRSPNRNQPQAFVQSYVKQHLRGLAKSKRPVVAPNRHTQSYFSCLDKSSSNAVLNDDFCDCRYVTLLLYVQTVQRFTLPNPISDGSDEPLTSACSGVLGGHRAFNCSRSGLFIFSSRVRDTIKDCPDGEDEE